MNGDGYPAGWQNDDPGPYPLGMPIWRDSWGPTPSLVYYGNGTTTPGPLLPIQYIAQTTINYNAGVGPALEPISLATMLRPPPPPPPRDEQLTEIFRALPSPRFSDYTNQNPPIGASEMAPLPGMTLQQFAGQRGYSITGYSGGPAYSRAGDIIAAASGLCDGLPPGYKQACQAAAAVGTAVVGGAAGGATQSVLSGSSGGGGAGLTGQCPQGYTWSTTLNRCIQLAAALPGGQPMTLTRNEPTQGGLGMTAVTPIQVGTIQRNDGSTGPILRCPRRYVLGQDYMCYPKSMIPNQLRAHPRGTRALLTGGEVKILRRARSLEKKVTKLGKQYGKKACHCSKPTSRRKK